MVEIVRRGILPEEKVHEATCGNCYTVFRFKQGEAHVTGDQRDGDYMTIACPLCNKTVTKSLHQNYSTGSNWMDR